MAKLKIRLAKTDDSLSMAEILREIGWSEKRNNMPLEEVANPIKELINHCNEDPNGHTMIVAVDENNEVIGFTTVHWVPFVMLGSWEGYISDVFVSPSASGKGAGSALVKYVMEQGENRGCMRLMLTNGKEKPSYQSGFYKKMGWTERPKVANFVYYYREPWS
ncbi:MAG: GNAT family N-acetyltransferase [Thermodesulfobacteriales bacterium]|jgi:GNAT superfamily N-acetyltransferase|nr:MAG: GNAT family N-acetyltransferase [Thermodesulfobacteriales bacterium]